MKCAMTERGKQIQVELFRKSTSGINPMQREDVKEKLKETIRQKYGVDNVMSLQQFRDKASKTTEERYGSLNYFSSDKFLKENSKIVRTRIFDYFKKFCNDYNFELLFDEKSYVEWEIGNELKIKCCECGVTKTYTDTIPKPNNHWCSCRITEQSNPEFELYMWLSSMVECKRRDRTLLKNRELDIVSFNKGIAVEFDGLFWHSEQNGKDKRYHLDKTERSEELGFKLIHVFEDEWKDKRSIVKNRLMSAFGLCRSKIYARKCKIKEIDYSLCAKFLIKYHIQGNASSSKRLGLFYKNRLVAVMTFGKPRFTKNEDWELIRYCTIGSFNVVGGASKLLSYFRKHHSGSIITYADRRWSVGNLYEKLGFSFVKNSEPNYYYVKNSCRISRYIAQKHRLKSFLGENFNPALTERQNMENNGYTVIWDCGNKIYKLES